MKRIAATGVLLTCTCAFVLCCWFSKSAISLDNYKRLQIGMTKLEVENILGQPRWEVRPTEFYPEMFGNAHSFPDDEWWGTDGVIEIWYSPRRWQRSGELDSDSRVIRTNFSIRKVRPINFLEKCEEWFQRGG